MSIKVLSDIAGLNHNKACFLDYLANLNKINLSINFGAGRNTTGDEKLNGDWNFKQVNIEVLKILFRISKLVKNQLKANFNEVDRIMIPAVMKNIQLFLCTCKLRKQYAKVHQFSYNYPILRSGGGKSTRLNVWLTKWYYKRLDRIMFYTEPSWKWTLQHKLIKPDKGFWAYNTIDTIEIEKFYKFQLPPEAPKILFIGRLIPSKRIPELLFYFERLKEVIPNLTIDFIGDGPESHYITSVLAEDTGITWHGTIINEEDFNLL